VGVVLPGRHAAGMALSNAHHCPSDAQVMRPHSTLIPQGYCCGGKVRLGKRRDIPQGYCPGGNSKHLGPVFRAFSTSI
jgi:hypothetical protein